MFKELDKWIRHRLRQLVWKRWKRGKTRYRELVKLGISRERAALGVAGTSPWRMSKTSVIHEALSNAYWPVCVRLLGWQTGTRTGRHSSGLKSIAGRYSELLYP